jgi:starch-binding outer membrane protein SusE/F
MKTKLFLFIAVLFAAFNLNAQVNSVAIVGPSVGGWPGDPGNLGPNDVHQMTRVTPGGDDWTITLLIGAGDCKLRANNTWGGAGGEFAGAFPGPTIGTSSGNITVTTGGNYTVTLNTATGVFLFTQGTPLPVVKLVGTAVTPASGVTMNIVGPDKYEVTTNLLVGNAKFDIDGALNGSTGFPNGNASADIDIPVTPAGNYKVTIDLSTGDYKFTLVPLYNSISIVGLGTGLPWPGGFDPTIVDPFQMATADGITYKRKNMPLVIDNIKFRQDNGWDITYGAAGSPSFPENAGGGDDISVNFAGNYRVNLNKTTKAYKFDFPPISIVGPAAGGWPGDPGVPAVDANFLTTTDGETYTLNSLMMTAGKAKFRYDNAWADSTGGASFPSATISNGDDIVVTAGTYGITYTRSTGAYTFGAPLLANENFTARTFKVSPNPSSTNWEIVSGSNDIKSVQIVNILGKVVYSNNEVAAKVIVDASDLSNGIYFARVSSDNATETIKLIKN